MQGRGWSWGGSRWQAGEKWQRGQTWPVWERGGGQAGCRLWALFLHPREGRPLIAHHPGSLFLAQLLQQPPNLHLSGPPGTTEIFKLQSTFLVA